MTWQQRIGHNHKKEELKEVNLSFMVPLRLSSEKLTWKSHVEFKFNYHRHDASSATDPLIPNEGSNGAVIRSSNRMIRNSSLQKLGTNECLQRIHEVLQRE
jgi:hypothetical protein